MNAKSKLNGQRVAIVTGPSSAIGLGITQALLQRGYNVLVNSRTVSRPEAGNLGDNLSVKEGRETSRLASLYALAAAKKYLRDLNRLKRLLKLTVLMVTTEQFTEHAQVADGACLLARPRSWTRFSKSNRNSEKHKWHNT
jgi:NAD(P)-dependent dehydrogenase (short-subunit alcohol dehydrogenase family)